MNNKINIIYKMGFFIGKNISKIKTKYFIYKMNKIFKNKDGNTWLRCQEKRYKK